MQELTKEQILSIRNFIATTAMQDLIEMGWDFTGEYDPETSQHQEFHDWVDDCVVQVIFRNGDSIYVIQEYRGPEKGWVDWAELPTGDDDKSADDIIALVEAERCTFEDDDN